jgi:hypothetical protein
MLLDALLVFIWYDSLFMLKKFGILYIIKWKLNLCIIGWLEDYMCTKIDLYNNDDILIEVWKQRWKHIYNKKNLLYKIIAYNI